MERGIGRHVTVRCSDVNAVRAAVVPVLEGNLDKLPTMPSRTVRVFLSSTFSDMTPERNALMEQAYPRLKEYCRTKYRFEFQAMDLRWGIREQSHDDHTIIEFCMREIENCKRTSVGPTFVAFLGQKYGYRPFPPKIAANEFEAIRRELVTMEGAWSLLDTWFRKDTNSVPNVYVLQPISSVLAHYADMENKDLQKAAEAEWQAIYSQLQQLLRRGVTVCVRERASLPPQVADKYFISVTEMEIQQGLLSSEDASKHCLCFMRHVTNLEEHVTSRRAQKYLDTIRVNGEMTIDADAQKMMESLRKDKILRSSMDVRNISFFRIKWNDVENRNPSDDPDYLQRFSEAFCKKMEALIDDAASRVKHVTFNSQVLEIHQHLAMCQRRGRALRGRDGTLDAVRARLQGSVDYPHLPPRPVVLHGQAGCGKTSVVAKIACCVRGWLPDSKPIIILRFFGATSRTCSIRLVLGSVCWQLASCYGLDTELIPDNYPGLVAYFNGLLQTATAERPLVVLLDGLNQLSVEHRAHRLNWLPRTLPAHVHLILSTTTDHPTYDALQAMASWLPESSVNGQVDGSDDVGCFVEVPPLNHDVSVGLVRQWLHQSGRDLTKPQLEIVNEALKHCSLPLYTSLVFEEVRRWSSYDPVDQTTIERTISLCIDRLLDRVERYHGRVLVSHALAYLTASKDGLGDVEMEDILSLDDVVLNDVFQHWLPPVRRIPPLLIPRLQDALASYIVQREANGMAVLYWYHTAFIGVARGRYLSSDTQRRHVHSTLAHYFLGSWGGGRKKPFQYSRKQLVYMSLKKNRQPLQRNRSGSAGTPPGNDEAADRMVPKQPLHFGPDPRFPGRLNYNLRKLSELPHHLLKSGMISELKSSVLFNYDWLHAKLSATSIHDVLYDFDEAIKAGVSDPELGLVASALRVGGPNIGYHANGLAFDLLGRLLVYYDYQAADSVLAEADETPAQPTDTVNGKSAMKTPPVHKKLCRLAGQSNQRPLSADDHKAGDDVDCDRSSLLNGDVTDSPVWTRRQRALGGPASSGIRSLLQQCDSRAPTAGHCTVLPILQCFDAPTALSLYVLEGHATVVSDIAFSAGGDELVSVAGDGTVACWDLTHGGERCRTFDVSDLKPGRRARVFPSSDGRLLVVDGDAIGSAAHVYDFTTGNRLHAFGDRVPTQSRVFLTGNVFCRQKTLVDVRTGEELTRSLEDFGATAAHVAVSLSVDGRRILVGGPGTSATLWDVATAQVLAVLEGETVPSSVVLTDDSRLAFVGYTESCRLGVFDVADARDGLSIIPRTCFDYRQVVAKRSTVERMSINEVTELSVSPSRGDFVLMNVGRRHLLVYRAVDDTAIPADVAALRRWTKRCRNFGPGQLSTAVTRSAWSADGRLVLATTDTALHVWRADSGSLTRSIPLRTMAEFPLAVSRGGRRNLAATGSTLHTAIRVWDLDAATSPIELMQSDAAAVTYRGPVDCTAVARDSRLVFIKNHIALSTYRGYKYAGWCGVDVWNLSTGHCRPLLTFDRYGRLYQLEVSPDGERLAMLLCAVNGDHYVAVLDLHHPSTVRLIADHPRCSAFVVSPAWDRVATYAQSVAELWLWSVGGSHETVVFRKAGRPVFTLDGYYLVYVDSAEIVVAYSLTEMAPRFRVNLVDAGQLTALPIHHRTVLVAVGRTKPVSIYAWKFGKEDSQLTLRLRGVAASGLEDVSKDGVLAVDRLLQVFDVATGLIVSRFWPVGATVSGSSSGEHAEVAFARLTFDGRYVVWAEAMTVVVGRVSDGFVVTSVSAHERVTSLATTDFGYVIVAGREDGRVLTMKLVAGLHVPRYRPSTAADRRNFLLDAENCSGVTLTTFDPVYRRRPIGVDDDDDGGSAFEALKEALLKRADVPHAVLTSSDWLTPTVDVQSAGLYSPAVPNSPPAHPGHTVPPMTGLFNELTEIDGNLRRPEASGLCSSAHDLHKIGLTSTAAMRRRFRRSRSHGNLLRIDVRSSPSDTRDHLITSTPRFLGSRSPGLLPCVSRHREEPSTDCLSTALDSAIRSSGLMMMQMCGIDIAPSIAADNKRKARSLNI